MSTGAVSYALNGKSGVSDTTRTRVLDVAAELGWKPRPGVQRRGRRGPSDVGLVIGRPGGALDEQTLFSQLIAGVEAELAGTGRGLLLATADHPEQEISIHRRWHAEGQIGGVILTDLREHDERLPAIDKMGLPAVVLGPPEFSSDMPSVWVDDTPAVDEALDYLTLLGHRRIARVAGPGSLVQTQLRSDAFVRAARRLALPEVVTLHTNFSSEEGARATRRLLAGGSDTPTAIVYDNDTMAAAAVNVSREMNIRLAKSLSIIAWHDSPLCWLGNPTLTAINRRVAEQGAQSVRLLDRLLAGERPVGIRLDAPVLMPRSSTDISNAP